MAVGSGAAVGTTLSDAAFVGRRPRRRNWTLRLLNRTFVLEILIDLAPG